MGGGTVAHFGVTQLALILSYLSLVVFFPLAE